MDIKQDKAHIQQLKKDLKAAKEKDSLNRVLGNYRLLKLAFIMVLLAITAAFIYGKLNI
ncbi:MAG: hypothetical protein JXB29_07415 [Sedimentisphaerales bacterium]|nr:hypothetical protein [Sedimentisphaerales bacterium]